MSEVVLPSHCSPLELWTNLPPSCKFIEFNEIAIIMSYKTIAVMISINPPTMTVGFHVGSEIGISRY